ncbi:MAG: hypothetical protein PHN75_11205 [Syntrophales bacterium]|nr:hypothetical protein [Syntrophales bacterium]
MTPYTIDIRYEPTKPVPSADAVVKKRVLTVANFIDVRQIDDTRKVGYVLRPNGRRVLVFPDKVMASAAVAVGVRDYFYKGGYTVSGVRPDWDLKETTIGSGWGDIVIGGSVNKLEIVCDDSQPLSPVRTYSAIVNLGVTVADATGKKILYKTSAEGSSSLQDVSFSIDKLQGQLNGVLSDVIEKLFSGKEMQELLKKVSANP